MSNCEYGQKLADAEFGGGDDPPKQMISVSEVGFDAARQVTQSGNPLKRLSLGLLAKGFNQTSILEQS